jgi:hypothetical protein
MQNLKGLKLTTGFFSAIIITKNGIPPHNKFKIASVCQTCLDDVSGIRKAPRQQAERQQNPPRAISFSKP